MYQQRCGRWIDEQRSLERGTAATFDRGCPSADRSCLSASACCRWLYRFVRLREGHGPDYACGVRHEWVTAACASWLSGADHRARVIWGKERQVGDTRR